MKRKYLLLTVALLVSFQLLANDGRYYTRGNHLVPLAETEISIRKEILIVSLMDNGYAHVDVYYEFWNPTGSAKTLLMGFEADPPYNDDYRFHPSGAHPNIHDFIVEMNGQPLAYNHAACINDSLPLLPVDTTKQYYVWDNNCLYEQGRGPEINDTDWVGGIAFSYVYYFEAQFKPGLNRIHHTYTYRLSIVTQCPYIMQYKLTPASRWAGGKIDDFTLIIRADSTSKHFYVPTNVFPGTEFKVTEGSGKIRVGGNNSYNQYEISLRNGAVQLNVKDFRPKEELNVTAFGIDGDYRPGWGYDSSSPIDLLGCQWYIDEHPADSSFWVSVINNLPFAQRGHVFRSAKLKEYFESLWWYMPDPDYKDSTDDFTEVDFMCINFRKKK